MSQGVSSIRFSQAEIAELFSVDRTTIRAWTKQGMPFQKKFRGQADAYMPSVCLFWKLGKGHFDLLLDARKVKHSETSAVRFITLGKMLSYTEEPAGKIGSEQIKEIISLLSFVGYSTASALVAIGYCLSLVGHFNGAPEIETPSAIKIDTLKIETVYANEQEGE